MLINLIFNSVDAMESNGRIAVGLYSNGEDVVLSVGDTGTGMTEEVQRRCLEPFFSTKEDEGSGLGLALAYGIVQRHKGTIQIESEAGRGTSVIVRLPAQVGSQQVAAATEVIARTGALRVLAVDDQPMALQIVSEYLTADGHTVETAVSGREALQKFNEGEFDVVVTDRAMPEMNGDQLAANINEAVPGMPVILLTGFGDMMLAKDEKVGNVAVVVGKPITLAALRDALAKAVNGSGASV
jgi:CheY-like chemotaxis protein